HEFATERFSEDMLAAQPGIEVPELGTQDSLLQRVGEKELGIAAAQELGKQREVGAVFAGHLKVTNPKGTGGLAGLVTPHLAATFSSRCFTLEVPGMGSITWDRRSSQASATCAGVAWSRAATRASRLLARSAAPAPSGYHGRKAIFSRSQWSRTPSCWRSVGL